MIKWSLNCLKYFYAFGNFDGKQGKQYCDKVSFLFEYRTPCEHFIFTPNPFIIIFFYCEPKKMVTVMPFIRDILSLRGVALLFIRSYNDAGDRGIIINYAFS